MSIRAVQQIGSGCSSNVYIGVYEGRKVALKRIDSNNYPLRKINEEIEILEKLSKQPNEYVIKYEGTSNLNNQYVIMTKYLDEHITLSIFLSKIVKIKNIPGSFIWNKSSDKRLDESSDKRLEESQNTLLKYKKIMFELCKGLMFIHENGIVHRDVKPLNILISVNTNRIKYIDFGLASQEINFKKSKCGTYSYMDPSLYSDPEHWEKFNSHKKSDLYSLSCIIYKFMSKKTPFDLFVKLLKENKKEAFKIFEIPDENQQCTTHRDIFKLYSKYYTYDKLMNFTTVKNNMNYLKKFAQDLSLNFNPRNQFSIDPNRRSYYINVE